MRRKNVSKPVRHRCDDVDPRRAAVPGGVRVGGGEAGLRQRRAAVGDPTWCSPASTSPPSSSLPPEEDLQGRRPHRRRHRGSHRGRPHALALPLQRVHQPQVHLREQPPRREARHAARRQGPAVDSMVGHAGAPLTAGNFETTNGNISGTDSKEDQLQTSSAEEPPIDPFLIREWLTRAL